MRFPILGIILVVIFGCSALEQADVATSGLSPEDLETSRISGTDGSLPDKFQLHDVPHNSRKQRGTDCAPDSLRMVLAYRGKEVGEDITRLLTSRGRSGGTTFRQMQDIATKHFGLPSFMIGNCDLYSIKSAILSKWPPIVGYRSGGRYYHAVVAVGYDDKRRQLLVHDPNIVGVRKIRYSDLGGLENDSIQRLTCLLVLPEGSTMEDLVKGLERYVPKELSSKLFISGMIPLKK